MVWDSITITYFDGSDTSIWSEKAGDQS
jgi:hypothetical protein